MIGCIGIDVSASRGCAVAILDPQGRWIDSRSIEGPASTVAALVQDLAADGRVAIGIDSPRCPLQSSRSWYWRGKRWRLRLASEKGSGRHCEVVLAAHDLANPQWTPLAAEAPAWMVLGFKLFGRLSALEVYEVFPSASYKQLAADGRLEVQLPLRHLSAHPKDMLDAFIAALTVREFVAGHGCEVGGGDGLGTIVLPRPLSPRIAEVLRWPGGGNAT